MATAMLLLETWVIRVVPHKLALPNLLVRKLQ
jgi:hypothetical protein